MTARWEFEHDGLRLDGPMVDWTMKNVGDEAAHPGDSCGEISIWRHAAEGQPPVDTTPWTTPLSVDRLVEPQTAHTMTHPVTWEGQEHGQYIAQVTLHDNVMWEIYFNSTLYGVEHSY
jgi:hypothetical protein